MTHEIVEYNANLKFKSLSAVQMEELNKIISSYRFQPTIKNNSLEFAYSGRDANRYLLDFWQEIAAIIGNADGLIKVSLLWETDEETFESFKIENGKLIEVNCN